MRPPTTRHMSILVLSFSHEFDQQKNRQAQTPDLRRCGHQSYSNSSKLEGQILQNRVGN
jgi:hypothetical protein